MELERCLSPPVNSEASDDFFFGSADTGGRTFLTPSNSSDASNLLLLSRTPFRHTRITPLTRDEQDMGSSELNSSMNNEFKSPGDEDLLFLNTANDEDMIINQCSFNNSNNNNNNNNNTNSNTKLIATNNSSHPPLRNESKQRRHNQVPLLEPDIFDSVDAALYENFASHTIVRGFTLQMEKTLLDQFVMDGKPQDHMVDSNEYRDYDNGYFYEELKDTSTNADGRKKKMMKKKKKNTNSLNDDEVIKTSKNINIKNNNNDDSKRSDNKDEYHVNSNLKLDPVECKKHKACRKPNKHVGRCKFIYDA